MYRDITWCNCPQCLNLLCKIRLTDEIQKAAREVGLPYAAGDRSNGCMYFIGNKESCNGTETDV